MEYIVHRRFKTTAICGAVNLPAGTICELRNSILFYEGRPLCVVSSENAHQHFARNDDGKGMERGQLIRAIITRLQKRDDNYQSRWDKVWEDSLCRKYKRTEHHDWLWNHAFYNASMEDLEHIAELVNART